MARAAMAAVAVALCCGLLAAPALADTGSIAGTVTAFDSHEPLEGVEVCAWSASGGFEEGTYGCRDTASDGTYAIAGLQSGEYEVEFWSEGAYAPLYLESVGVVAGETTALDAELHPKGWIVGTVTDENDEPVANVEACAYAQPYEGFAGCGITESDGTYSIPLPEGAYTIEFWAPEANLAVEFYDDATRREEADPVHVAEGTATEGIDASLAPGATITGTVTSAATGSPLAGIRVCSIDAVTDLLWICSQTDSRGAYQIGHHRQGAYKVVFSPELSEFLGFELEPGEEDDGYPTQFWNDVTSLAAATPVTLARGATATGIDAKLGPAAASTPVLIQSPALTIRPPKAKRHCKRHYVAKKIRGKLRCVKRHRRKHHRHRRHHRPEPMRAGRFLGS